MWILKCFERVFGSAIKVTIEIVNAENVKIGIIIFLNIFLWDISWFTFLILLII